MVQADDAEFTFHTTFDWPIYYYYKYYPFIEYYSTNILYRTFSSVKRLVIQFVKR